MILQQAQKVLDETKAPTLDFNRVYGEFGVILIDEKDRLFTAFPNTGKGLFGNNRNVTSFRDVYDLHPDLVEFDMVEDIEIDIKQMTKEMKRTVDGQQVSYDPPHYEYSYVFTLHLKINHKYIKSMYITLNSEAVHIKNIGQRAWTDPGKKLAAHLLGLPNLIVEDRAAVYSNESLLATLFRSQYEMPAMSYGFKCTVDNWKDIQKYQYYLQMAREIRDVIMGSKI